MKINKKIMAIATAMLALLASCSGSDETVTNVKVTLMLNWTPNAHHAGIYLAQANGWYEDAGIDLEIIGNSAAGVEVAVAEGVADIGIAQSESIIPARNQGIDVKAVATILPVNDSSLVFLSSEKINSSRDLEGKTYGGYDGALEVELVSKLVECDGGDPSKVRFVSVGNVDYLAGLDLDRFDFAWVFEGWDVLRAKTIDDVAVSSLAFDDYQDCIPNWYTPLLLTKTENADSDMTSKFLEVTARGYKSVAEDPAKAAEIFLQEVPETDEALITEAIKYYAPLYNAGDDWGKMDAETWTEFGEFLAAANQNIPDDSKLWEEAFTNESLPG